MKRRIEDWERIRVDVVKEKAGLTCMNVRVGKVLEGHLI